MPPSADASAGRAERTEPTSLSPARAVPPPRSAPQVESTPAAVEVPGASAGSTDLPAEVESAEVEAGSAPVEAANAEVEADGLTERQRRILAFERNWWRHAGAKEQAIRDTFGLSATRYYQLLNALLDEPAALAAEPLLVGRLRRLRSSRARNRRR